MDDRVSLERLDWFLGSWEGHETGKAGVGTGSRTYEPLLGRYVMCRNRSEFAPQEANPDGEVHEDLVVYSYDEGAETIVGRAFHTEGFVKEALITGEDRSVGVLDIGDGQVALGVNEDLVSGIVSVPDV